VAIIEMIRILFRAANILRRFSAIFPTLLAKTSWKWSHHVNNKGGFAWGKTRTQ